MERHDRGEQRPLLLQDRHPPRRHRAAVAETIDDELDVLARHAGLDERGVNRMWFLTGDGRGRREHGLGEDLAAENTIEPGGLARGAEATIVQRLELECPEEALERLEDRRLEEGVAAHDDMVTIRP